MKFKPSKEVQTRKLVAVVDGYRNRMFIQANIEGLTVIEKQHTRRYTGSYKTLEQYMANIRNCIPVYEGDTVEVTF